MPQAARLTDPIGHSPTGLAMLTGALIGGAIAVVGVAAVVGTGGLAAPALLGAAAAVGAGVSGGAGLGELLSTMSWMPKDETGCILESGSPDVLVNGLPAARAHPDVVVCDEHDRPPPLIAMGSESVLINGLPAAREGDETSCSAVILSGSPDVQIGGGTVQTDIIHPEHLVPDWVHGALTTVGIGSAVVLAGPVLAALGVAGGFAGAYAGSWAGAAAFGEGTDGHKWSMLAGSMLGGLVGARAGVRVRAHQPSVPFRQVPSRFKRCRTTCGDPVDLSSGHVQLEQTDFTLRGRVPLEWTRRYDSGSSEPGVCGVGWQTPADARLVVDPDGSVTFHDGEAGLAQFPVLPFRGPVRERVAGAQLSRELGQLVVTRRGGRRFVFPFPRMGDRLLPIARIEDGFGNALEFVRSESGLRAIVESAGRRIAVDSEDGRVRALRLESADGTQSRPLVSYAYDEQADLVAAREPDGPTHTFVYQAHRLIRRTDPLGRSFYYTYDRYTDEGRCVHTWGDDGLLDYHIEYARAPRATRYTDSLGHTWISELDDLGYVLAEVDPAGGRTTYAYDKAGRTVAVTDPAGREHSFEYDDLGNLVEECTPDGALHTYAYDDQGRLTAYTDPAGRTFSQRFDARGHLIERVQPDGGVWRLAYTERGDLRSRTDPLGHTERYDYDLFGNRIGVRAPTGAHTRYAYDLAGNCMQVSDPEGALTRFEYDACDRLLSRTLPSGAREQLTYDAAGDLSEHRDAQGQVTRYAYSALGDLTARVDPDGRHVQYHYDTEGRVTAVADRKGRRYRLVRDPLGRVVRQIDYWGATRQLAYDPAGQLVEQIDELGVRTQYARDPLGRILEITAPDRHETFAYDLAGNLVEAASESGTLRRSYDAQGRVVREEQPHGDVAYRYDLAGRLIERTSSLGHTLRYGWDADGALAELQVDDHPRVRFERDLAGRVTTQTLNGILSRHFQYDADGRLRHQELREHDLLLRSRSYRYAPGGDLLEWQDAQGRGCSLTYDPMGQVAAFRMPGAPAAEPVPELDEVGGPRGVDVARVWARRGLDFGFDRAGRVVSRVGARTRTTFDWDSAGHLTCATPASGSPTTFTYDPLARRTAKRTGDAETRFLYDGVTLLGELDPSGGHREYVFYPGTFVPFAWVEHTGALRFYETDAIGHPHEVISDRGALLWRAELDGTGRIRSLPVAQVSQPLRFQGQYHDPETNLAYTLHRYHDPDLGTFISKDPLALAAGEDLYAYAPNPWSWIDPWGLIKTNCKSIVPRFDDFEPGQGFSGVFEPRTGTVAIRPSSAAADLPPGFVRRRGGHAQLRAELQEAGVDTNELQGFTAFMEEGGALRLEYFSRGVNGPNPSFPGNTVPTHLQPPIRDAVSTATGRLVR